MTQREATNITWHQMTVDAAARAKLKGHKGAILWFTGLSASGKSVLASAVEAALHAKGVHTYILDGDNIRHGLNKDLGFSPEDRHENIRRIGQVAHLFADAGQIVITSFISPYIADRQMVRDMNDSNILVEILCDCPIEICEQRDPKGLYKKARAGEITQFTGIDAPYETPPAAELVVNTGTESVEDCTQQVLAYLQQNKIIPA